MATQFKSLIVLVGPPTGPGRPATCFTFSQPRMTKVVDACEESEGDDELETVKPRRTQ